MSNERRTTTHDQKLEARLACLEELFVRFAQTGTVENTLGHGFDSVTHHLCAMNNRLESIAAELTPLRTLSGTPVPLTEEDQANLYSMSRALARPVFKQKSLPVDARPVPYIGDGKHTTTDIYLIENRSTAP